LQPFLGGVFVSGFLSAKAIPLASCCIEMASHTCKVPLIKRFVVPPSVNPAHGEAKPSFLLLFVLCRRDGIGLYLPARPSATIAIALVIVARSAEPLFISTYSCICSSPRLGLELLCENSQPGFLLLVAFLLRLFIVRPAQLRYASSDSRLCHHWF
jgi:hypothetical protein